MIAGIRGQLVGVVFSLSTMCVLDQAKIVRFDSKHIYSLSCLAFPFWKWYKQVYFIEYSWKIYMWIHMWRSMPVMLSFLVVSYSHIIICQKLTSNLFVCLLTFEDAFESLGLYFVYDLISASETLRRVWILKLLFFLVTSLVVIVCGMCACGHVCLLKRGLTLVWAWTHSNPFALACWKLVISINSMPDLV